MKKSKPAKKKKKQPSKGHKLFETAEGIQELFKYELDKYYISVSGEIISINDTGIFSRKKVEEHYESVILSICQVVSMPKNHKEREEAIKGLITMTILPFRVH